MTPRAVLKETVYGLAHAIGLPRLGRHARRDGLTVITYHSFGPAEEHPYLHRLAVARFTKQITHLRRYYEIVALEEGLARLSGTMFNRRPLVAITVDDGYGDNYEHLFPVVRAAGVPATIFLATDYLDTGRLPWPTRLGAILFHATFAALAAPLALDLSNPDQRLAAGRALRQHLSRLGHEARERVLANIERALRPAPFTPLRPLTWEQVREMRAAGIAFGAHTHYHGWLDRLSGSEVDVELARSLQRIEAETGTPCRVLAYPNGNWNEAVADAARRAGFVYALTQEAGVNRAGDLRPFAVRRVDVPFNECIGSFACRVAGVAL